MVRGILTLLTAVAILAHAILGCCWHHGHGAECCADAGSSAQAGQTESTPPQTMCACGHHHAAQPGTNSGAAYESAVDDEGDGVPRPATPCSHGRCTYLSVSDAKLRESAAIDSAYVAMPTASPVAVATKVQNVAMCDAAAVVLPCRTARVRLQVWLT